MTTSSTARRLACGLLAAASVLAATACGAGRDAQTYQERNNAESSNASAGSVQLRNVLVEAPEEEKGYEVGDDATVVLTLTSRGSDEDRLVEVTSSAAREVAVVSDGDESEVVVPGVGSPPLQVTLELRGLTRALRAGEIVDLSFRFAENGTVDLLVPVATTGEADRPIYTGERFEGGEEPALQGPAGGHSEGEGGSEDEAH